MFSAPARVAEWYTRTAQTRLAARPWGFESPPGYETRWKQLGPPEGGPSCFTVCWRVSGLRAGAGFLDLVDTQVVRLTGNTHRGTGEDDDALPDLDQARLAEVAVHAGHHVLLVVEVLRDQRVDAPRE